MTLGLIFLGTFAVAFVAAWIGHARGYDRGRRTQWWLSELAGVNVDPSVYQVNKIEIRCVGFEELLDLLETHRRRMSQLETAIEAEALDEVHDYDLGGEAGGA